MRNQRFTSLKGPASRWVEDLDDFEETYDAVFSEAPPKSVDEGSSGHDGWGPIRPRQQSAGALKAPLTFRLRDRWKG